MLKEWRNSKKYKLEMMVLTNLIVVATSSWYEVKSLQGSISIISKQNWKGKKKWFEDVEAARKGS